MTRITFLTPLALALLTAPTQAAEPANPLEIPGHRADIFCLAFSPNGELLAPPARIGQLACGMSLLVNW